MKIPSLPTVKSSRPLKLIITFVVVLITAFGNLKSSSRANSIKIKKEKMTTIEERLFRVRRQFEQTGKELTVEKNCSNSLDIAESTQKQTISQWYNWPNDWNNWRKWNNWNDNWSNWNNF
jgi:hypothetical protein